jgi:hypothetical protein
VELAVAGARVVRRGRAGAGGLEVVLVGDALVEEHALGDVRLGERVRRVLLGGHEAGGELPNALGELVHVRGERPQVAHELERERGDEREGDDGGEGGHRRTCYRPRPGRSSEPPPVPSCGLCTPAPSAILTPRCSDPT